MPSAAQKTVNFLLILLTVIVAGICLYQFGNAKSAFYGDAFGYYVYLPSTFIHHNLKTPFTTTGVHISEGVKWCFGVLAGAKNSQGYYLNQYTYGIALMELPFFGIAHLYEKLMHLDANGYSSTYDNLIRFSSIFYALAGLLLVFKVLRYYFSNTLSLLGVIALLLCTNMFWFVIFQTGMAHIPLFFLYALLVWLTIKIHDRPTVSMFLAAGFTAGLITLIRPSDIICLLIPFLYQVYNKETFKAKLSFLKAHKVEIANMAAAFIIPLVPQLLYWKSITGGFICYSYGDQSFNWSDPKIIEGLFYFTNGWLPYSPIMIFSILGLLLYRKIINWELCIAVVFCLYVYIIYSWYCYYYLNGLGSRPMIHLYPLLALPLTTFFKYITEKHWSIRVSFLALCMFFAAMNICYSVQQILGVIDSVESNMAYNLQMLFRTKITRNDLIVRDVAEWQPDSRKLTKVGTLAIERFDDSFTANYLNDSLPGSKYVYHMQDQDYLEVLVVSYDKKKFGGAKWFKCSGRFMCPNELDYYRHLLVLDVNEKQKLWRYAKIENNLPDTGSAPITLKRCITNKWGEVSYFARIPGNMADGDMIKVIIWTTDKRDMYMDDICLELYK